MQGARGAIGRAQFAVALSGTAPANSVVHRSNDQSGPRFASGAAALGSMLTDGVRPEGHWQMERLKSYISREVAQAA